MLYSCTRYIFIFYHIYSIMASGETMLVIFKCKNINVNRFSFLDFFSAYKRHIRSLDIN